MVCTRAASVLVVFAHPDDELFHGGILASLSERGARVTLACATRGEAGRVHPSVEPVGDLGALRANELRESCRRLGIEPPVFLGFHDSARKERLRRDDPRALANIDMLEAEAAIRKVIRKVRPHVVVTFEPHGGYYHPDHVAIHRATTAAFFSSGWMGPDAPERLFYGALLRDVFLTFARMTRGRGIVDDLDADVFATTPEMIAVSFDARRYAERKLSALAAHRSQFGLTDESVASPSPAVVQMIEAFRPVMEREVFVMGGTRGAVRRWPLNDFFDGLETAELSQLALPALGGQMV